MPLVTVAFMGDHDFFRKRAEWWREWAKLAANHHEKAGREKLAEYYERLAKEHLEGKKDD